MGVAYNNVLHIDIGAGAPSTLQQATIIKTAKVHQRITQFCLLPQKDLRLILSDLCFVCHSYIEHPVNIDPISSVLLLSRIITL